MEKRKGHLSQKINAARRLWVLRAKQIGSVLFLGLPVLAGLLLRDRKTIYFLPHVGLGDYCIALGYLKSYKKYHGISHVTLIIPANRVEVAGFYPYWDEKLILPRPFYLGIAYLGSVPGGMAVLRMFPRIMSITYTLYSSRQMLEDNPEARADELVKIILKLPKNEKRLRPVVPSVDISAFTKKHSLKQGKTVLINPYTGGCAVKEINPVFYERLADKLYQEGYAVVTILGSETQKPILGTAGIQASLAEAWYLAQWCGWLVGMRSGFFDFVQSCGCNMIAIYDGSYKQCNVFALGREGVGIVREYNWNAKTEEWLIEEILADIKRVDSD